ncbi:dihydroneopterin aldolase [Uliginosibacterium paludis]|uniref:dihydroneopterin aldolase n=1 Tax=Uliginosibacterium paludis TaxID=1615952 RepID=A0ABV2CLV9_9RHOO
MDFIFIEGMLVDANVGIFPRERSASQPLEINMTFGVPDAAALRDDIADTVGYDQVVERIREVLLLRQFNLLETLGEFVVGLMFEEFNVPWVRVSIAKPGVMKNVRRVGVFIERGRNGEEPPNTGLGPFGLPRS